MNINKNARTTPYGRAGIVTRIGLRMERPRARAFR